MFTSPPIVDCIFQGSGVSGLVVPSRVVGAFRQGMEHVKIVFKEGFVIQIDVEVRQLLHFIVKLSAL